MAAAGVPIQLRDKAGCSSMKRTKRGMALILAAVMVTSCVTTILLDASKNWTNPELGSLSQYYETGTYADPGAVSNVTGDPGGVSYGLYMFSAMPERWTASARG